MSKNVYAKFRCAVLHIKKALGILRELITTTRTTTRVAFRSKNICRHKMYQVTGFLATSFPFLSPCSAPNNLGSRGEQRKLHQNPSTTTTTTPLFLFNQTYFSGVSYSAFRLGSQSYQKALLRDNRSVFFESLKLFLT